VSSNQTLVNVVKSEWIKFRTVRSSVMGVIVFFVLTLGLGGLISWAIRSHWSHSSVSDRLTFDPVSTSLAGIIFAQFAVGVIGVLFITSEYSSGSIRTTLTAVSNRLRLISAKTIVLAVTLIVVSEVVCFATFELGQSIFKGVVPTASLGTLDVLRSVLLAGAYLTLLTIAGFALGSSCVTAPRASASSSRSCSSCRSFSRSCPELAELVLEVPALRTRSLNDVAFSAGLSPGGLERVSHTLGLRDRGLRRWCHFDDSPRRLIPSP